LLKDLLRHTNEFQPQAAIAQQPARDAQRWVDESQRGLGQTAAGYDQLKEQHTELAET
jgi:hypothetical protein